VQIEIRASRVDDGPMMQSIERLAGERFREVGLDRVAEDDPPPVGALAAYATAGRSWVAVDETDQPVGYVVVDVVDGNAHIEQVSVDPAHQGAGVGRALVEQVRAWAAQSGRAAVTLTTFADVPWNAPLYQHLGFVAIADGEIGPELRALRDTETECGLDPGARLCMRLDIGN
jgi:GNAT superfamily N-acetyltransferase